MAARDKVFGGILCIVAVLIAIVYLYALFGPGGYALWAIEIVVTIGLLVFLGILFWVGYTIASTPSIEEVEKAARRKKR